MPEIALRCRKYTPTTWIMALRLTGKEIPADLRVGGKELRGQYAQHAKEQLPIRRHWFLIHKSREMLAMPDETGSPLPVIPIYPAKFPHALRSRRRAVGEKLKSFTNPPLSTG